MAESTRGILTEADRDFLRMDPEERPDEYTRSAISQRWKAIRGRLSWGLTDLVLLYHNLPEFQRQAVYEGYKSGTHQYPRERVLLNGGGLLLLGEIEQRNIPPDDEPFFEEVFARMLEHMFFKLGGVNYSPDNIELEVSIDGWSDPDKPFADLPVEELSEQHLRKLLFNGEITSEEFARGVLDREE